MTDGKISLAPCGHPGIHVVGDYVHCPRCDALPNRDQIDPTRHVLCSRCRTLDVVKDAQKGGGWWKCNQCGLSFVATRGNQP